MRPHVWYCVHLNTSLTVLLSFYMTSGPQWNPSHPTAFTERERRSLSSVVIEDDVGPHHLDNLEQELINQLIFTHLMVRKWAGHEGAAVCYSVPSITILENTNDTVP